MYKKANDFVSFHTEVTTVGNCLESQKRPWFLNSAETER